MNAKLEKGLKVGSPLSEEELTALITGLFAAELGIAEIESDSHFLFLGADSMNVERLMESIGGHFAIDLSTDTILEAPTPRALAQLIMSKLASRGD